MKGVSIVKKGIVLLMMIGLMTISFSARKVLVLSSEYKPLVSETAADHGILAEIITEAFSRIPEYDVRFDFYPWTRCEALVESGYAWGAFPFSMTEERQKRFLFSDILFQSDMVFFYDKRALDIVSLTYEDLSDLRGYAIGCVSGYYYKDRFEEAGLNMLFSPKEEIAFRNLVAGRVDLVPMMDIAGWTLLKEHFSEKLSTIDTLEKPFDRTTGSMMVSKIYPESEIILEAFNLALKTMREDGTYQKLIEKIYDQFPIDESDKIASKILSTQALSLSDL